MKIAQIGCYPLSPNCINGGIEASVYGLAKEQSKQHEVVCFDYPRLNISDNIEEVAGLRVYRYKNPGNKQKDMTKCLEAMVLNILDEQPDICHIHGTGLLSKLLYERLQHAQVRLMLTIHGLAFIEKWNLLQHSFSIKNLYKLWYQSKAEFALLRMAPYAIVDTKYVAEALSRYPCRIPNLKVIPQGVDARYSDIHRSTDASVILSVGSISKRKGHLLTLEAFEQLRKKGFFAKLKIYGVVAEESYLQLLQSRILSSAYSSDVELHLNAPFEELLAAYSEAYIFALHTQEESQGIAFVEAMACGLPIVATKVGGVPYVVTDGKNGLLSEYADTSSMAQNMARLLSDTSLWKQMSDAAREESTHYQWSNIASQVQQLYEITE